jgi:uncharacterized YigZ family protein
MKYFYSVDKERIVEIKIKRSKFIAHLFYAETIKDAKNYISEISGKHNLANHNCWAYIVGDNANIFHSSDAGEPSGTAGQPMLNMLKKYEMTNIACVVTRYFGGVKLGIRGLIEAYGEAVEAAIKSEKLIKLVKTKEYSIETNYAFAETLKYKISQLEAKLIEIQYSDLVLMKFQVEMHLSANLEKYLNELSSAGKLKLLN